MLAGAAGTLLLLLAFMIGLAVGRPDAPTRNDALRRDAAAKNYVVMRLRVPVRDATAKVFSASEVRAKFVDVHQVKAGNILRLHENTKAGIYVVDIGPFRSAQEGDAWIESLNLRGAGINSAAPFQHREFVPYVP